METKRKDLKREILEFIHEELELTINRNEVRELLEKLENAESDFYIEIDGEEYRFIHDDDIWDIYVEAIQEITEECYDIKAPSWLVIDWEKTADNCIIDGYGHTFNHYDGGEIEYDFDGEYYHIFRVN